jgi:hypothetical protein
MLDEIKDTSLYTVRFVKLVCNRGNREILSYVIISEERKKKLILPSLNAMHVM